jgi:hypothetical protein
MRPNQSSEYSLVLAPLTAASTERTASFNLDDCEYVSVLVTVQKELNTNAADVKLTLSENDSGTNWTKIAEVDVDNTDDVIYPFHVNKLGRKRQLELKITPGSGTNNVVVTSATVVKVKDIQKGAQGTVL